MQKYAYVLSYTLVLFFILFIKVNSKTDEMKAVHIDKSTVGKFISTKAVGSNDREDITNHYKYKEGKILL